MVKSLQKKFMTASMIAVTILLLILVGAINILNAVSVTGRQRRILETLSETDAQPDRLRQGPGGFGERKLRDETGSDLQDFFAGNGGPGQMTGRGPGGRMTVDNILSARFFAVWTDETGAVEKTDVSRIYAVDEETASLYGQEILASGRTRGTWKSFRFLVRDCAAETGEDAENPDTGSSSSASAGGKLLVAMDISSDREGMLTILGISALIAALCWLAMLWPVYLLAKRAIAPTAVSIERQKQFVTNAGHELKTPLAIIQANTEALELYNGESKWTRNIRAQTVRLGGLMQNLLTLSRMDETGLKLDLHPFYLDLLACEVWEDFAQSAEGRALTVSFDLPEGEGTQEDDAASRTGAGTGRVCVLGNRDSVAQLLSILYDNAVKYTPRRGEIRVRISETSDGAELVQSNTVPPAGGEAGTDTARPDPDRLFDRFYRPDEDRSRKKGGSGIGLSAARAIAEANRGSIGARYEGDRIIFTFRIGRGEIQSP